MNVRLEKLFEKYDISIKDKRDFLQIYSLLPGHKKIRVIENFDTMMGNIAALRDDLYLEQEILFWKSLTNIEEYIAATKKNVVSKQATEAIASLKSML